MAAARDLSFPAANGRPMRAAFALPAPGGKRPAMIVIHEIFGLNDDIRRITGRFADLGYVALAPDLFDTGGMRALCILRTFLALRRGDGPAFADLEAARSWLAARPEVDPTRTGVVGFCMGGGFALLYAVKAPLGAAGVFYGQVP
ncbi:MAG TPA: dienelactone hydrolase family protein, partial [Candidatus Binatus sp.]|nr:dienelactone hydrolase family protein [Candidatus Binatus sp.]